MVVERFFVTTGRCTFVGWWGHQVWPVLNFQFSIWPSYQPWVGLCAAAFNLQVYAVGSAFGLSSFHDGMISPLITLIGLQGALLILVLGKEWGSFWCFQASALAIVAIFEREIIARTGFKSSSPAAADEEKSGLMPTGEPIEGVFDPAAQFEGERPGWVFLSGAHGIGYYKDEPADCEKAG